MSANINITKRGASMFSRKEMPWHGLGQILQQEIVTAQEALDASRLDYEVKKIGVSIEIDGQIHTSKTHFATYRDDTKIVLGTVGKDYQVVQNIDCLQFLDEIIKDGKGTFETAGALGNGERIFITVKMNNVIKLGDSNDVVEEYLFITNSHDGSGKVIISFTPTRIVCNNTLQMALQGARNKITLKHTTTIADRMHTAQTIIAEQIHYHNHLQQVFDELRRIQIREQDIRPLMCKIVLTPQENELLEKINYEYSASRFMSTKKCNILNNIMNTIESGIGQEYHRGTALWLFNGITSYYQNTREYSSNETKLSFLVSNKYVESMSFAVNSLLKLA